MSKHDENFLNQSLDQVMSDRFGKYSKYIIQERALPDARDGLKPVQRRIIFSMSELGLIHNKPFKKSARVVGDVIGKYHPHGDSSIYEALVRMSQPWKINIPLVEMHGNNGSIDDDPAAAMRYTESRLTSISNYLIDNIKRETVKFAPNFDDSEIEPTVLPALFPNLLVNGAKGIAAGYATEMPPHNLGEVIDAIVAKIKSPNARLDTLMKYIHGPDFPTGGTVKGLDGIYQAFERGKGKIVIRAKYTIIDQKTKPAIMIEEVPYGVVKSKLVKEIDEVRVNNKINGIKSIMDESDREGLSIRIELMPGANINSILNYLLAKTEMQIYYHYNNVAISKKAPTLMNLNHLIDAYLNHQKDVQTKALNYDLSKYKVRLEIVSGLIKVSKIVDEVIETIKNASGSKQGVVEALMKEYGFTKLQAQAIADLRLYRLSRTDQDIYLEEEKEMKQKINEIEKILGSEVEFNKFLIGLLKELKAKYATPRKTIIDGQIEAINVNMESLIKHENVWIGISKDGYVKRFSNRAYDANELSTYELRENDALKYLQYLNTRNRVLIFTSKGNYYIIPAHKFVETKFKEIGKHLNDFAALSENEFIVNVIAIDDFKTNGFIILASKNGKIKKVKINDFLTSRHNKLYKTFNLQKDDQLIGAKISNGTNLVLLIASDGKAVKYFENQIPIQGTKSSGVKGIILKDNYLSAFGIGNNDSVMGFVSLRGGMKRIKMNTIFPMNRNTQGKSVYRMLKGEPHLVQEIGDVSPQTDVLFFSKNKMIIKNFKNIDITSANEGFSLTGPKKCHDALINKFITVRHDDEFFKNINSLSAEDKFNNAEKTIDKIAQIDIDDLLKDIK